MTDVFERTRSLFDLPDGVVYLDGNSLGAMPRAARERVRRELDESWGRELIRAWNTAGWIDLPARVGDRIGALIGAPRGSVVAGDSTSVNLFKALTAALQLVAPRKVILSDSGNFPTDLYVAEGVCRLLARGHELKIVGPEAVESALDDRIAAVMLTEVESPATTEPTGAPMRAPMRSPTRAGKSIQPAVFHARMSSRPQLSSSSRRTRSRAALGIAPSELPSR